MYCPVTQNTQENTECFRMLQHSTHCSPYSGETTAEPAGAWLGYDKIAFGLGSERVHYYVL